MNPRVIAPGLYGGRKSPPRAPVPSLDEPDLSIADVATMLGQSRDTILDLVRSHRFFPHAYKAGSGARNSPVRIPFADVLDYRAKQPRAHG
ncbi:helix-turn-helix domain-containing protein [Arthrobacter sp. GMC3]|uniref:helix-turn-helix domain-containing protein n=1 Tax=Arthrobacter sp. GMC3 TaxID=2058894 RepID=UPI000CE358B6|nr:helix-turn-helix domain-containing protein [Arthrobacter sp. GMC3]